MKAIAIREPGGPEVLELIEAEMPVVSSGEILVAVRAAGINRPDISQRLGKYPVPADANPLPGLEISGTVAAVGDGVSNFDIGDAVMSLHAFDLLSLGINVDCLPVLDVPVSGGHEVIGNRAYSDRAETIALLGQCACDGLKAGGVMPVIKHIPGHGRATADSHKELPVVDASRSVLEQSDFIPFKRLAGEVMAMTAHVIYTALDKELPATTSPFIINDIIRKEMGFDGLLMSDDVSMHALSGDFSSRTRAIFGAGCDIVLHCNGDMAEMQEVAQSAPELAGLALKRANLVMQGVGQCDDSSEVEVRAEFEELMSVLPAS